MIEERRPNLERMSHAHTIDLDKHVFNEPETEIGVACLYQAGPLCRENSVERLASRAGPPDRSAEVRCENLLETRPVAE